MMKINIKSFYRNSRGVILPLSALLAVTIVSLCGVGTDISYYGIVRASVEKATEAASVAGAQEYFRSKADAGKAINSTIRVFKMNISKDTSVGNYYPSTGSGRTPSLSYSRTFTVSDSLSGLFRGSPIKVTVVTNQSRGKISVTSEITAKPLFSQIFGLDTKMKITREAELPPYDVVFVVDESGSMRFATVNTYIGTAWVEQVGMAGTAMLLNDVVLYQSQSRRWGRGSMITANGLVTTIVSITDVLINSPNVDIHIFATYDNGRRMYLYDPERDYITNTLNSQGLRRTALTGLRLDPARLFSLPDEARQLYDTFYKNRSIVGGDFANYFNVAAKQIEPHASTVYGVMSFIDTVKIYGTSALKLGLATFSTNSYSSDMTFVTWSDQMKSGARIVSRNLVPYVNLVNPSGFNEIVDKLTIMTSGNALGLPNSPIGVNSYPDGGTNINQGLMTAERTLNNSDRPGAERVIILFTDGEPTHSFTALGNEVKRLTDRGIRIYSIVLTLAISQSSVNNFKDAMENRGMAEPVVFIDDPAKLDEAFMQIADELGLKLIK